MMNCYQCNEPAKLCENPGKRLFCKRECHVLYHESWQTLINFFNRDPALKRQVKAFCRLGMKRTLEDDVDGGGDSGDNSDEEDNSENDMVLFHLIEFLPDDVWAEILVLAFRHVGTRTSSTMVAMRARNVSMRMKRLIDSVIFNRLEVLGEGVTTHLEDAALTPSLFCNLKEISIWSQCKLTTESISRLTTLERLRLNGVPSQLTEECLFGLPHLKELEIRGTPFTDRAVSTLTNLETLLIDTGCKELTDKVFLSLPRLKSLSLIQTGGMIVGDSLTALTNLETLLLCQTKVEDDALIPLASSLQSLTVRENVMVSDNALIKLTNLESLRIGVGTSITDVGVMALTKLRSLALFGYEHTPRALSTLSQLTSLELGDFQSAYFTVKDFAPFKETLQVIEFHLSDFTMSMLVYNLEDFPSLTKGYMWDDEKEEYVEFTREDLVQRKKESAFIDVFTQQY